MKLIGNTQAFSSSTVIGKDVIKTSTMKDLKLEVFVDNETL